MNMKKNNLLGILLIFMTFIIPYRVNALVLEKNEVKILPEEIKEIKLSVDLKENKASEVSFDLIYNSYDLPGEFIVLDDYTDVVTGTNHSIVFDDEKTGTVEIGKIKITAKNNNTKASKISLTNATATKSSGEEMKLYNQELTVSIGEDATNVIDGNLLKSIDSEIVSIPLIKDKFTYNVKVKDDIKELDLKPIPNSGEYKVDISSQEIDSTKVNKIEIKVSDEDNDIEETYTINIEIEEKRDEKPVIIDYKYKNKYMVISAASSIGIIIGAVICCIKNKQKVLRSSLRR